MPAGTPYSPGFEELYSEVRRSKNDPFRESRQYLAVGDLRPYGYRSILHAHCKYGVGNYKLELVDTGILHYGDLRSEIRRVFAVQPGALEVARIDLAVDIQDVPVAWFVEHARAKWKRFAADIGQIEYARMGKIAVETFYLGKRPNCYRIYDKLAEFHFQYSKLKRKAEGVIPPFEQLFGYPEKGIVLTRVERQIGGGRVPEVIGTVSKLARLPEFDPFQNLEIAPTGLSVLPNLDHYDLSTYLQGLGLRQFVTEHGMHRARRLLNRGSKGNASRILNKLSRFLPVSAHHLTEQKIFQTYQRTVEMQLAA